MGIIVFLLAALVGLEWAFAVDLAMLDCIQDPTCRLVDAEGTNEVEGHYTSISRCVEEAQKGDVCLIRPGRYEEKINKKDIDGVTITGILGNEKPIIDGTVVLYP